MNALALKMQRRAEAIKHEAERMLKARVMAATGPEQKAYIEMLQGRKKQLERNAEQKAFELWFAAKCPSGDCESVQFQWEGSDEFADFHADSYIYIRAGYPIKE